MRLPYRMAKRSEAKPMVGLYGRSHSGKTKSALLLARGFVGSAGKITMIETEGGRGEIYVDELPGGYHVLPIRGSYPPKDYGDAMDEAAEKKTDALIIDSGSHEWEGPGGVLSMASANKEAGYKGQQVWLKPKMDHAMHFLLKLQTTPIPLVILCMRAKYPMEETVKNGKKDWTRSTELVPIQSEDILSEMLISGWIEQETHVYRSYSSRRADLAAIFRDGECISMKTGEMLAQWAAQRDSLPTKQTTQQDKKTETKNGADLQVICVLIGAANTVEELEKLAEPCGKLTGKDKDEARRIYRERLHQIQEGIAPEVPQDTGADDIPDDGVDFNQV